MDGLTCSYNAMCRFSTVTMFARYCFRRYSSISKAADRVRSTTEKLTGHSEVLAAQELVRARRSELVRLRSRLSEGREGYEHVQQRIKALYARKTQVGELHHPLYSLA